VTAIPPPRPPIKPREKRDEVEKEEKKEENKKDENKKDEKKKDEKKIESRKEETAKPASLDNVDVGKPEEKTEHKEEKLTLKVKPGG
jgi:hypothetical protein